MNTRHTTLAAAAGILCALYAGDAWAIGPAGPTWEPRELVTDNGVLDLHIGQDRYLAYDHHGDPGIAVVTRLGASGSALYYARRVPGVGWTLTSPTPTGLGFGQGRYPSLAFDHAERPAISAVNAGNVFYFHHFDGLDWTVESLRSNLADVADFHSSLAFDRLGRAMVAFHLSEFQALQFILDTDGDFDLDEEFEGTVDSRGPGDDAGLYVSLAVDPLNRPIIAHTHSTLGHTPSHQLLFSAQDTGRWTTTVVDGAGDTGLHPSLAIDPNSGHPAIAYYDADADDLRFAKWNGNSWDLTTIDSEDDTGLYPSLAFDPGDGNPVIAYYNATDGDLKLAWHDGAGWQDQVVDSDGDVGKTPSLAFNEFGTGFPSIAYFSPTRAGTDEMYFIADPPAVPEPAVVGLLGAGGLGVLSRRRRPTGRR